MEVTNHESGVNLNEDLRVVCLQYVSKIYNNMSLKEQAAI